MKNPYIFSGIAVMALMTYIIRAVPMLVFRKKITNLWIRSFLYYVPYTVLAAMTFPAVFSSTGSFEASFGGFVVALILSYMKKGLLTVAVGAAAASFIIGIIV